MYSDILLNYKLVSLNDKHGSVWRSIASFACSALCSTRYAGQLIFRYKWMCYSSPAELPISFQASLLPEMHCTKDKRHWLSFPRRREGCLHSLAVGESNKLKMPTGFEK